MGFTFCVLASSSHEDALRCSFPFKLWQSSEPTLLASEKKIDGQEVRWGNSFKQIERKSFQPLFPGSAVCMECWWFRVYGRSWQTPSRDLKPRSHVQTNLKKYQNWKLGKHHQRQFLSNRPRRAVVWRSGFCFHCSPLWNCGMRFYSGSAFRFWCSLYCESLQRQGKASKGQFSESVQEVLDLEQNTHCQMVIKVVSSEFTMFRNCDWPCVGTPIWLCWKGLGVNFVKVRIPRGRSFFKQSHRHLVFWLSGCWASVEESGQSATCSISIHICTYIMQYTCRMLPYTTIPYTTYTTFWKQPMSPGEFCHQRSFFLPPGALWLFGAKILWTAAWRPRRGGVVRHTTDKQNDVIWRYAQYTSTIYDAYVCVYIYILYIYTYIIYTLYST